MLGSRVIRWKHRMKTSYHQSHRGFTIHDMISPSIYRFGHKWPEKVLHLQILSRATYRSKRTLCFYIFLIYTKQFRVKLSLTVQGFELTTFQSNQYLKYLMVIYIFPPKMHVLFILKTLKKEKWKNLLQRFNSGF